MTLDTGHAAGEKPLSLYKRRELVGVGMHRSRYHKGQVLQACHRQVANK